MNINAQLAFDNQSAPMYSDGESLLKLLIEESYALIDRAERALDGGDYEAAVDLLRSAGKDLMEAE